MRNTLRQSAILFFVCAALAAAQKKAPPDFAYDPEASFTGLKSYAWFDDPKSVMPGGNAIVDGQFIDRSVRQAVEAELARKGFTKVEKDASFYVAYHESDSGGLSQDKWGVYSWWTGFSIGGGEWYPRAGSDTVTLPPSDAAFAVDTGTKYRRNSALVLDIRDSQGKLIWRGARMAKNGTNPHDLARAIDHAVARLLSQFPPKTAAKPQ